MSATESPISSSLSGPKKAAVLLVALGLEASSEMLKHLSESEIQQIVREIKSLEAVPPEVTENVLKEFSSATASGYLVAQGGTDFVRKLLSKALGPAAANKIMEYIHITLDADLDFTAVRNADPKQLSALLQNEHPQTIALILAHLKPAQAQAMLLTLPEDLRPDVAARMANLEGISPDIMRKILIVLGEKLKGVSSRGREKIGGVRAVAEMLNHMDRISSRTILDRIEQTDPDLALNIRNRMIVFEDILTIDDAGIREILQRVDKKVLALALKGTSEELQQRFFSNMSARVLEFMLEEMEYMGSVKLKDVARAQRDIIEEVRRLEEEGVLTLTKGGEDEFIG